MHTRKAVASDLPAILAIYKNAIDSLNSQGIAQWDEIYPDEAIITEDVENGFSYVRIVDEQIASVFAVNQSYDPEYESGNWRYPEASFAVIHRLCVSPSFQHRGIGHRTMLAAEAVIKSMQIDTVRLDAFSQNPAALKMYGRLGYQEAGTVYFRKGRFVLLEKKL
ncbi:MAG: GNAT family N-acetyltransferase [Oscillospiraceae bacterium]|jgi:ribosomal protein S18 acetylase RimI-like enzyme|nr:GNAT family N-acetyltransferase [Oscillospiraceae bacterium]